MTAIFARASEVYGYLGKSLKFSKEALDSVLDFRVSHADDVPIFEDSLDRAAQFWISSFPTLKKMRSTQQALRARSGRRLLLINLWQLLCNPWFERVWIVQEVVVARKVILVFSRQTLDLEELLFAFLVVVQLSNLTLAVITALEGEEDLMSRLVLLYILCQARQQCQKGYSSQKLLLFLLHFSGQKGNSISGP
jgi:hypothetical protein